MLSTIKDQKSNYGIPLDIRKSSSEIRENFVSDPQLNMDVTIDLQQNFFVEPAESCPHWLKFTLSKKLGRLIQKYRIAV